MMKHTAALQAVIASTSSTASSTASSNNGPDGGLRPGSSLNNLFGRRSSDTLSVIGERSERSRADSRADYQPEQTSTRRSSVPERGSLPGCFRRSSAAINENGAGGTDLENGGAGGVDVVVAVRASPASDDGGGSGDGNHAGAAADRVSACLPPLGITCDASRERTDCEASTSSRFSMERRASSAQL